MKTKTGTRKTEKKVTTVAVEVSDELINNEVVSTESFYQWGAKWAGLRDDLTGGADADISKSAHTIGEALELAEKWFPTGGILASLGAEFDNPRNGKPFSIVWVPFCTEVEMDITPTSIDDVPTFGDFLESIARNLDHFILKNASAYEVLSPHQPDDVSDRKRTGLPQVLGPMIMLLLRVSNWFSNDQPKQGQTPSPVYAPYWRPTGGAFHWEAVGRSKRRK